MAKIRPIFFPLCQQLVGEAALRWRRAGLSAWNGQDINLCGVPAKFTVDGTPTCKKHVLQFTDHDEHKEPAE